MTKNESFKHRIRERMAKTGERYTAARHALIEQTPGSSRRVWVSEPEFTDEVIVARTGRSWDDWCDYIEAWPGHIDGHTAIAAHIHETTHLDGWWSQGVTVGYERIVGERLTHQMADGTFTANKSMTIAIDADELRAMLLHDDRHMLLGPGLVGSSEAKLRSRPTSKSIRIEVGPGIAMFTLEGKGDGRTKVVVSHEKLPNYDDVAEWKFYWAEWLAALDLG